MILSMKELVQVKEVPMYNEVGFLETTPYNTTQPFDYTELIKIIEKTPESIGILNAMTIDICSDGYSFEGPKYKIDAVKDFLKKNRFKNEFRATVFDWLMLGNGALWKGKISEDTVKEIVNKVQTLTGVEYKETEMKALLTDEDLYQSKLLKHAPWSTMNIDLSEDKTSISSFRQTISSLKYILFSPEEIIHGKFMDFNGKVYGFSPVQASVNILSTLSLIKDLNGNFFQNGGVPDWMFILPKEMAGSPNVQKLEQALRKYKSSRHKHGNLVFTGEVTPIQMNKFDKDMEFRQLAIYYTGILALSFNMPLSRVASILGAEVSVGAADSDLSEAGYWRSISSAQDYWEDLLNTQLFEPEFGVSIHFNRGYKNDEIKEAQRDAQMMTVLDMLMQRKAVTPEYIKYKMHIPDQYFTGNYEVPEFGGNPFGNSEMGSPGSPPSEAKKGDAKQENDSRKKRQAVASQYR